MLRLFVPALFIGTALLASYGSAAAACFTPPLPATPIEPIYTMTISFDGQGRLDLWRQSCQDGSGQIGVLMRITPTVASPFVCSSTFIIVQSGVQLQGGLFPSTCTDLFVPTTLMLTGPQSFNPFGAFRLIFNAVTVSQMDVPSSGLLPQPPPTVTVVATGCTTCHSGQVVAYEMHFTNPGAPMLVELKGGARFPDESILPLLVNAVTTTLPSGPSVLTLVPAQALPALPTIDLLIEAAILEPALGVTLSRHNVTLHLLP